MISRAPKKPSKGESASPWKVLVSPLNWIAPRPADAIPAPTIEKTSAWLELDGMPFHQVSRSQTIAERSAAITSSCVASSGATIPLPTVVATAVPVSAPTTLSTAAISTATPGASTRVATEVAIALAVSWKPLMKSKPSPIATIRTRTTNAVSGMLQHDPFERVGDVLGAVRRVLQLLIELAPADRADQRGDVGRVVVEAGERVVEHVVGLVLQPVDVDGGPQHRVMLPGVLQLRDRLGDQLRLLGDDPRQQAGALGRLVDAVEPQPPARLLDVIDEVVA